MKKAILLSLLISSTLLHGINQPMFSFEMLFKRNVRNARPVTELRASLPNLARYLEGEVPVEVQILFDHIEQATTPIILKFYADWCPPCKRLNPIISQVVDRFGDKLHVITINVDHYPRLRTAFNVMYIPTLIFFNDKKEIKRANSLPLDQIVKIIEDVL